MKKGKPKTPYILIGFAVFCDAFAMVVAVTIYLAMKEYAATFTMRLLLLLLPIIATIIIIFDLRFHLRDLKSYRQAK
ncbi:MAG TPA: hypothetical protein VFD03_06745 [Clostridia bacterium]|nr:hypothetical protein [Clostridia bacterium]